MSAVTIAGRPDREAIQALRRPLPSARHLPGEIYASPEILKREKERIFLREWLCAARAEELPEVGDYLTLSILGEPVILTRNAPESIVGHLNMCRHRGAALVEGRGSTKLFSCPYHAWSYDLSGRLVAAPRTEGLDLEGCSLPQVRTAIWRGWVFINLDPGCRPFEEFIKPWEDELWFYQAGECRVAFKKVMEFQCNWKFIVENVMDFYHAQTVHFASFAKQFDFSSGPLPLKELANGGLSIQFDTKTRQNFAPIFPLLPWLSDHPEFAAGKAAVYPNMNLFSNQESMRTSVFWPVATDRMQIVLYFLLPQAVIEAPDFEEKIEHYRSQVETIAREDQAVVESLQRAAASSRFEPGPLIDMESGIRHMLTHYLDVMDL